MDTLCALYPTPFCCWWAHCSDLNFPWARHSPLRHDSPGLLTCNMHYSCALAWFSLDRDIPLYCVFVVVWRRLFRQNSVSSAYIYCVCVLLHSFIVVACVCSGVCVALYIHDFPNHVVCVTRVELFSFDISFYYQCVLGHGILCLYFYHASTTLYLPNLLHCVVHALPIAACTTLPTLCHPILRFIFAMPAVRVHVVAVVCVTFASL